MKMLRLAALAATSMLAAAQADAATFVWAGGTYVAGTTSPSPLLAGDILSIETAANHTFGASAFVNQSGVVNWQDGTIFFGGGTASATNGGTWNATGDNAMTLFSGGGTFTNTGVFAKTGGTGNTTIGVNNFVNSGTLNAQTGTILLNGGGNVINAGSAFTGAGTVQINSNATFNGGFTSSNLDLSGANFTGNNAALTGSADFLSGNLAGAWNVTNGSTLNLNTAANKGFGAGTFDSDGNVVWNDGTIFLGGGSANIVNDGTFTATADNALTIANGGGTLTNNGLFQKTGGTGTTSLAAVTFVNSGTIAAQTGTVRLDSSNNTFNAGSAFTGAGIVSLTANATFTGGFTSTNLDFNNGTYTGNGAALSGSADFLAGTFNGAWNVTAGSTLNVATAANKGFGSGTFDNDGTLAWSNGTIFTTAGTNIVNDGTILATGDNVMTISGGVGALANTGVFRKTVGTGTTDLVNINVTNTGLMDVQSGTIALPTNFVNAGTMAGSGAFQVAGTLTNNGTIAPGNGGAAVGTLGLTGNYAQGASGLFSVGFGPGSTADLFNISGTAALNGTLGLNCLSCSFNVGDVFTILDSVGALSGTFANVTTSGFNNGFAYSLIYDTPGSRVQVRIDNVGTTTPPPVGGAVPEPATWAMMLLGFGAIGGMLRRRERRTLRVRYA